MDSDTVWRHIDEQRVHLADLLDALEPEQWSTPSLCEGWTVREVAAHITHSQLPKSTMVLALVRSGFRFNAMIHRAALQDKRSPRELIAALRAMPGSRKRPPGTSELDPLLDVLVHTQDIAVPLGIDRPMPVDAAVAAAGRVWNSGFPFNAQRRLRGVQLAATDADFRVGQGRLVEAPIREILMALTDRPTAISGRIQSLSDR
ncbi:TIGR03083 family protein [Mycolicibacterium rutilum]|uniref:TIGR03083 family protein n=1 Tax=Mycolicibacterium rutilum TaxID=370526 RepID=A0A1H6KBJ2_MYCRU|nr:maleylpyruvate isomerase family mycothiol-dependent enzyme [Mycolicibacterium rutilum]SEH70515.1 TIGR03083 family protein [Mycolicibacterium rutilum]